MSEGERSHIVWWHHGLVVSTIPELHSTKPVLRFCTGVVYQLGVLVHFVTWGIFGGLGVLAHIELYQTIMC